MAQKKVRSCIVFGRRMACARVSQIDPVFPCHGGGGGGVVRGGGGGRGGVQHIISFVVMPCQSQ